MTNRLIKTFRLYITFSNIVGAVVGGLWLSILGEWKLIGTGIIFLLLSKWLFSILTMPGAWIANLGFRCYRRKYFFFYLLSFLAQFQKNLLIFITCGYSFLFSSNFYDGYISIGYIPYLLWSLFMALGSWQYFQSKEPDNPFSTLTLFSVSVFYPLSLVMIFINPYLFLLVFIIFGIIQLFILSIFNIYLANQNERKMYVL